MRADAVSLMNLITRWTWQLFQTEVGPPRVPLSPSLSRHRSLVPPAQRSQSPLQRLPVSRGSARCTPQHSSARDRPRASPARHRWAAR